MCGCVVVCGWLWGGLWFLMGWVALVWWCLFGVRGVMGVG